MAQSTSSTASVDSTNGIERINLPVNADNIVRSVASTEKIGVDSGDLNNYPVIVHALVTGANQLWFYDLGDEATRDADLSTF